MSVAGRVTAGRWLLRGLLLFTLTFANLHDIWSPDVVPNALFAWTLLGEGNVDYDEFTDRSGLPPSTRAGTLTGPGIPRDSYFFRACGRPRPGAQPASALRSPRSPGSPPPPGPDDRACSIFPPGISLLALPILAPFVIVGAPPDGDVIVRAGHLAAAIVETLAALLLWSVLRRFASPRWSLALILLYWLATSVRTIASQALWQHAGVHLALAIALWLVLHERVSVRRELLAGIALGFGTAVRQTTAVGILGLARLPWPRIAVVRPSAPIALFAGAAVGVLPLLVYGQIAFGSPLEQGYGEKAFDAPIATGLLGLLVSPSRGLLVYEPWTLAALGALVLAWRRPGLVPLRLRGASVAWLLLLSTYARYAEWWGGRVFGPRFLDDLAPALVAALAWGISQGLLSRAWARIAFAAAAAWSLLLFNVAALVYDPNGWDTVPTNVNFDPARLFSWSDPQWLDVLTSLASADARVMAAAALSALLVALLIRVELWRAASRGPTP